jgi:phage gp36-like protein
MFLTQEELKTHLYGENVDVITRDDDTIVTAAVDGAIAEAKSYLGDYNTESIFGASGTSRHALLLIFVKDIAVWHLINLSNPGIDFDMRQKRYDAAIAWLKGVQKGNITPDLPKNAISETNPGTISYGSNPKRIQHY